MITSLKFQDFRIFPSLEIAPLQRVNLIAGANNTGKTGILEGLYLSFANDAGQLGQLPLTFRGVVEGDNFATFWETLFYDKQTGVPAEIIAKDGVGIEQICSLTGFKYQQIGIDYGDFNPQRQVPPCGLHNAEENPVSFLVQSNGEVRRGNADYGNRRAKKFIVISTRLEHPTRDADLYNQVALVEDGEEKLLHLLRQVDPRLQKLRYAKAPGTSQAQVYASFGLKNALSITQTGQGFSKLFSLFCQMLVSKAEVLLIDEIENGLYYETLPQIWKGIAALAESEKIQVFATTHSRECIIAAHETIKELPSYDFALHRVQRVKGKLEVVTHDQGMLEVAIKSGLEIR